MERMINKNWRIMDSIVEEGGRKQQTVKEEGIYSSKNREVLVLVMSYILVRCNWSYAHLVISDDCMGQMCQGECVCQDSLFYCRES